MDHSDLDNLNIENRCNVSYTINENSIHHNQLSTISEETYDCSELVDEHKYASKNIDKTECHINNCSPKDADKTFISSTTDLNFKNNLNRNISESNESLGIISWVLDEAESFENLCDVFDDENKFATDSKTDCRIDYFKEVLPDAMSPISLALINGSTIEDSPIQLDKTAVIASTPKHDCEFSYTFDETSSRVTLNGINDNVCKNVEFNNGIGTNKIYYTSTDLDRTLNYCNDIVCDQISEMGNKTLTFNDKIKENITPNIQSELNKTWNALNQAKKAGSINETFKLTDNNINAVSNTSAMLSETLPIANILNKTGTLTEKSHEKILNSTFEKKSNDINSVSAEQLKLGKVNMFNKAVFNGHDTHVDLQINVLNEKKDCRDILNTTIQKVLVKKNAVNESFIISKTPTKNASRKSFCPATQNILKPSLKNCKDILNTTIEKGLVKKSGVNESFIITETPTKCASRKSFCPTTQNILKPQFKNCTDILNTTFEKGLVRRNEINESFIITETPTKGASRKSFCPATQNISKSHLSAVHRKSFVFNETPLPNAFQKLPKKTGVIKANKNVKPDSKQKNHVLKRRSLSLEFEVSNSKLNISSDLSNKNLSSTSNNLHMRHSISGTASNSNTDKGCSSNISSKLPNLKVEAKFVKPAKVLDIKQKSILNETISIPNKMDIGKTVVKKARESHTGLPKSTNSHPISKYKSSRMSLQISTVHQENKSKVPSKGISQNLKVPSVCQNSSTPSKIPNKTLKGPSIKNSGIVQTAKVVHVSKSLNNHHVKSQSRLFTTSQNLKPPSVIPEIRKSSVTPSVRATISMKNISKNNTVRTITEDKEFASAKTNENGSRKSIVAKASKGIALESSQRRIPKADFASKSKIPSQRVSR